MEIVFLALAVAGVGLLAGIMGGIFALYTKIE